MLTIWQLYVVGFVFGVLTVFFDVAYMSYLPSLVRRDQLVDGNSKLEISRSGAQLAGPALAGVLVQALTAPFAILVDALSFVASGLFVLRIRKREDVPEREAGRSPFAGMKAELSEGLRYVLGHRYLRWIAASTATFNFFGNVIWTIFLVYAVRELGLERGHDWPRLRDRQRRRARRRPSRRTDCREARGRAGDRCAVPPAGSPSLLVPLAPVSGPIPFLVVAQLIMGFGVVLYNVTQVSFRQAITPERLQGRMNSVMRFIVWGVMPLGMLLGGASPRRSACTPAIWVGAIGMSLAFLPVLLSPVRTLREMPEPVADPLAEAEGDGGRLMPGQMPAVEDVS